MLMKNTNLTIILLAIFSLPLLSGCTNIQADDDVPETCSIDQVEVEESCE